MASPDIQTKRPVVSIVIPVYNVEKYLPECIESVRRQTFEDFEMILVDDGSPDNSGKICDVYAARDSRIRVFHKENGGVVSARMLGLAHATGTFVIFLDGDDTWTKTALSGLDSVAEGSGADFIRGGFFYESEGRKIRSVVTPKLQGSFDVDELLARPFKTIFDYTEMCVWGNLYRKEIADQAAEDVGVVHINHSEDGLFAAAAFLRSRKIAFSRDPFYYYLQRDGSAIHRFNPQAVDAQEGFLRAMEGILRKSGRVADIRISEIMGEHLRGAISYAFRMLLRAPKWSEMARLRKEICELVARRREEVSAFRDLKSRLRLFILKSDWLCFAAAFLNQRLPKT